MCPLFIYMLTLTYLCKPLAATHAGPHLQACRSSGLHRAHAQSCLCSLNVCACARAREVDLRTLNPVWLAALRRRVGGPARRAITSSVAKLTKRGKCAVKNPPSGPSCHSLVLPLEDQSPRVFGSRNLGAGGGFFLSASSSFVAGPCLYAAKIAGYENLEQLCGIWQPRWGRRPVRPKTTSGARKSTSLARTRAQTLSAPRQL